VKLLLYWSFGSGKYLMEIDVQNSDLDNVSHSGEAGEYLSTDAVFQFDHYSRITLFWTLLKQVLSIVFKKLACTDVF
jgi:hypothetical protein